jgi:hypothetical protein
MFPSLGVKNPEGFCLDELAGSRAQRESIVEILLQAE